VMNPSDTARTTVFHQLKFQISHQVLTQVPSQYFDFGVI
jgi:hypothetical protein